MTAVRRALVGAGVLVMLYAVIGALADPDVKGGVAVFLIGVLVAHDAVLLPLVLGAGALAGRFVPLRVRGPVRWALVVSLAVTVVALPLMFGPSLLPYGRGLLEIYGVIWAAAGVAAAVRAWRTTSRVAASTASTAGEVRDGRQRRRHPVRERKLRP